MDLKTILEDAIKSSAPPLKTLCVIRYATELCNQKEIRDLLKTMKYPNNVLLRISVKFQIEWKMLFETLVNKLNSLLIPKTLKDKVLSYSLSIAIEILKWINIHQNIELPEEFCWTVKGTVDYKNTAKRIIENGTRCIKERYKLSCIYCQETSIFSLWTEMLFKDKNCFLNDVRNPIVLYWIITTCAPKGKALLLSDYVFQKAFLYGVENGYIDAVKYLSSTLHTDVRQIFLDKIFKYLVNIRWHNMQRDNVFRIPEINEADTWFFLFTNLSEDLQKNCFLNVRSLEIVLQMFLNSSRQKYLTMLIELENPYPNAYPHWAISFSMIYKYMMGCKDVNYRKTLIQFWRKMPNAFREDFLRKSHFGLGLFTHLIKYHFSFLLKKGTLKSKGKLISVYLKSMKLNSHHHFDRGNWKFLLYLIKDQVVTRRSFKRYKERFFKALCIEAPKEKEIVAKKILILIQRIRSNKNIKVSELFHS